MMGLFKKFIHDSAQAYEEEHDDLDEPLVKTTKFALYEDKGNKQVKQREIDKPSQKDSLNLEDSVDEKQAHRLRFTRYKSLLLDNFITQEEFDLLNKQFNDEWNYDD